MKILLLLVFSFSLLAQDYIDADPSAGTAEVAADLAKVAGGLRQIGKDLWLLTSDLGNYIFLRAPSGGTLLTDGMTDALLRTIGPVEEFLKKLEKTNPVNAAIVRDFSKTLTIGYKMWMVIPVDQSGRLYDRTDFYSQISKLLSKAIGFASLALFNVNNGALESVINVGGDVVSQVFIDSGKDWRESNSTASFESYLAENHLSSFGNAALSVPAKSSAGYVIGAGINKLLMPRLSGIQIKPEDGFLSKLTKLSLISISKSVFLTTGCKVAMDLTRPVAKTFSSLWKTTNQTATGDL